MGISAIRAPTPDIKNHQVVLTQLKEAVETGRRIRGNPNDSYVTLGELINAGIVNYAGDVISPSYKIANAGSGSLTSVSVQDSITGTGVSGSPLQLSGDIASPGNTMLYGTNSSGVKGWYAQPSGGGGSSGGNVTPDTHPTTTNTANDEFEYGSAVDTTGARFSGAIPWTVANGSVSSWVVNQGALNCVYTAGAGAWITQPISGTFDVRAKIQIANGPSNTNQNMSIFVATSSRQVDWGCWKNGSGTIYYSINEWSAFTYSSNPYNNPTYNTLQYDWVYLRIKFDGTNIVFYHSRPGYENTWVQDYTNTATNIIGGNPTLVGLMIYGSAGAAFVGLVDWFRRAA